VKECEINDNCLAITYTRKTKECVLSQTMLEFTREETADDTDNYQCHIRRF
jgi:hypothetical protein